jgi:hypothetical protein
MIPSAFHLPEVSRQIYAETATLGYKLNSFIASRGHPSYRNWATGLLPAYRKAIRQIEPDAQYLLVLINPVSMSPKLKSLQLRIFPALSSVIISDTAMRYITFRNERNIEVRPKQELKNWIKAAIRMKYGADIEVVFEERKV